LLKNNKLSEYKALLTIRNLSARIGRQVVLCDVSMDINEGECVAVVGGSGAGKSCLLRCIMGLQKPAQPFAGNITFLGEQVDFSQLSLLTKTVKKPLKDTRNISFVPQNPQAGLDPLKPLATQWQQALRCSGQRDMTDEQQTQLLNSFSLKPFGADFPHHWSQGMQQRLLIAFALLAKPRLLVLDEPTSALDTLIASKAMMSVMKYAKEHKVAVLIVTHDLALASRFAERVAIMSDGKIVEFGAEQQLLVSPKSSYGKLLVANRTWQRCN
jgi:ABC-type glutathione transport system ATPase component